MHLKEINLDGADRIDLVQVGASNGLSLSAVMKTLDFKKEGNFFTR